MSLDEVEISSNTIVKSARERKLGCETVSRGQTTSFELASMALHLVAMKIHAAKVICTSMDIQDNALRLFARCLAVIVVLSHLDPFGFEGYLWATPLPPCLSTDLVESVVAQLSLYNCSRFLEVYFRNGEFVELNPGG